MTYYKNCTVELALIYRRGFSSYGQITSSCGQHKHCLHLRQRKFHLTVPVDKDHPSYPLSLIQGDDEQQLYRKHLLTSDALDVKETVSEVHSVIECASLAMAYRWYHFRYRKSDLECDVGQADLGMAGQELMYARGKL